MAVDPSRGKWLALAGAVFVAFATGMALPFVARQGPEAMSVTSLGSMFIGLFALFAWIQFDRRQRGVPRSRGFNYALAWFGILAAPVYFVRHRARGQRWKPLLGLFLAATVGWNALLFAGMVAGGILTLVLHGPN
jgi:hypothetical protein